MKISPRRSSMTTSPWFAAYRRPRNWLFTKFARLLAENLLMIWKYAVPDPREVANAITIIINFDLQNPQAILPIAKELRKLHESRRRRSLTEESELMNVPTWSMVHSPVLHLLHTCHDARSAVLDTFCLDTDVVSDVWNDHLWDSETDVLLQSRRACYNQSLLTHFCRFFRYTFNPFCFTKNWQFIVQKTFGSARVISYVRNNCGINLVISSKEIFFPMQTWLPPPN